MSLLQAQNFIDKDKKRTSQKKEYSEIEIAS
jgi:hypothetical protein